MKKICLCLIIILLFALSACSSEARTGYKVFSDNLKQYSENYGFEYFDMFIYEHTYHTYLSLCSEDDVMLSMQIDEKGNIDEITVTAYKEKFNSSNERMALSDFINAVVDCYTDLTDKEHKTLNAKLSCNQQEEYFSNLYETYSSQRYHFTFSSNSEFVFFNCEYYEIMEDYSVIDKN